MRLPESSSECSPWLRVMGVGGRRGASGKRPRSPERGVAPKYVAGVGLTGLGFGRAHRCNRRCSASRSRMSQSPADPARLVFGRPPGGFRSHVPDPPHRTQEGALEELPPSVHPPASVCPIWSSLAAICQTRAKVGQFAPMFGQCWPKLANLGGMWGQILAPRATFRQHLHNSGARRVRGGKFPGCVASASSPTFG